MPGMKMLGRFSLGQKIVAICVAIIGSAIILGTLAFSVYSQQRARAEINQKTVALSAMLANGATSLVLSRDTTAIEAMLQTLTLDPDFKAGLIADEFVSQGSAGRTPELRQTLSTSGLREELGRDGNEIVAEHETFIQRKGNDILVLRRISAEGSPKPIGYVALRLDQSRLVQAALAEAAAIAASGILIMLVVVGLLLATLRRMLAPLRDIKTITTELSAGELNRTAIAAMDRHDEIGEIARALVVLRDNLLERRRLRQAAEAEAVGKLARQEEVAKLIADFQTTVGSVLNAVGAHADQTKISASSLSEATTLAEQQANEVAAASHQISQGSSELSRNIDGVSSVIRATSGSAGEALRVSDDLSANASRLRGAVESFLTQVRQA